MNSYVCAKGECTQIHSCVMTKWHRQFLAHLVDQEAEGQEFTTTITSVCNCSLPLITLTQRGLVLINQSSDCISLATKALISGSAFLHCWPHSECLKHKPGSLWQFSPDKAPPEPFTGTCTSEGPQGAEPTERAARKGREGLCCETGVADKASWV